MKNPIKILYLEDNISDIELTERAVSKAFPECIFQSAKTIADADKLLQSEEKYDLLLLDLNLPDGNGIDLLTVIRQKNLPIAIIILTIEGDEEIAITALKAGADDYLVKTRGYLKKLPEAIKQAIKNFNKSQKYKSEIINVLYVEWHEADIDFTKRHFRQHSPNLQIKAVPDAISALKLLPKSDEETSYFDILLMDYHLPGINALEAVKTIRQERKLSIPILIVTGQGNEEVAVQALKLGVDEYLVKRENYLLRLPSMLLNAYQKHQLEIQQKKITASEKKYKLLAENAGDVIFTLDINLKFTYVSPSVETLKGYKVEELINQPIANVLTKDSYKKLLKSIALFDPDLDQKMEVNPEPQLLELEVIKKDGTKVWTEIRISLLANDENIPSWILGVSRDISKRKIVEEDLFKSREEYKSFFEDDLTGDFISTAEGKLLNCNPAFLKICGFSSKEEALASDINKIFAIKGARNEMIKEIKENKILTFFEADLKKLDGKVINVVGNLRGGFDSKGNLKTIKGYLFDETNRKKAMDELRKLSKAVEQSPATVIITDIKGNIEYVNKKFEEVTGYSQKEVIGKNPRILKSGHQGNELYSDLWKTITSGKDWFGELLNKKKDGSIYWEQASISSIINDKGKITNFLAVKEDITDKKKHETALINALEKAQESDRLKTAFLHNISHEIRTPMNAIIGFSGFLKDPDLSFERKNKYSDIVIKSSNQLLSIITDIINIASLEAGQEIIRENDIKLNALLKLVYEQFKKGVSAKNIDLNLNLFLPEGEDEIISDETKLLQIITNLVGNAIKFTTVGSINFGYTVKEKMLEFYVEDTGIGIPANMHEEIFDRFSQVEKSSTRFYGGSGLGLSISKGYAELMGGNISLQSEIGKGSVFYVSIPYKKVLKEDFLGEVVNKNKDFTLEETKTLLVAEDEDLNFMLIEEFLSDLNINILRAKTGVEAIDLFKSNPQIDLVLMDIKMPVLNGYEATKEIRKFAANLPIIAQTAYSTAVDIQHIKEAGCNDILIKPFNQKDLMAKINEFLAKGK
ncbi:MAG: response regulator [Lutibacter sp.]|nr:response regulator [Lutibacter sp.]